jgi:hydrogenase maturation factor
MVALVPPDLLKKARTTLTRLNERSMIIGRVVKRPAPRVLYA